MRRPTNPVQQSIKCWGAAGSGQLGYGNTTHVGDDDGEMGDSLHTVDVGAGLSAVAVSAGFTHTCAVLANDTTGSVVGIKCWGAGGNGQLGYGNADNVGDGDGEMGDNLPFVDLGTGTEGAAVTAGNLHTWGCNDDGSLGHGDTHSRAAPTRVAAFEGMRVVNIACGSRHTLAAVESGAAAVAAPSSSCALRISTYRA